MERDFKKFYTNSQNNFLVVVTIIAFCILGVFNNSFWIVLVFFISLMNMAAIKQLHKEAKDNDRLYK